MQFGVWAEHVGQPWGELIAKQEPVVEHPGGGEGEGEEVFVALNVAGGSFVELERTSCRQLQIGLELGPVYMGALLVIVQR